MLHLAHTPTSNNNFCCRRAPVVVASVVVFRLRPVFAATTVITILNTLLHSLLGGVRWCACCVVS
jgi:hypothetical protein